MAVRFVTAGAFVCSSWLACASAGSGGGSGVPSPAKPMHAVAWVVPYEDSLTSLAANADWISVASPAYYRLAARGEAMELEDWDPNVPFPRKRLDAARARAAFSVWPLVGCIGACGAAVSRVLDDPARRKKHIEMLAARVAQDASDGLFIDYEDVDAREASVSAFFTELAERLHAKGKKLGIAVQEPCGTDPSCARTPYPFALSELAARSDLLAVMEYDYAVDGASAPAPRAWVERGLSRVARDVPRKDLQKVLCGIPLYGRASTSVAADNAVLFRDVYPDSNATPKLRVESMSFDAESLAMVGTATAGKTKGPIYIENAQTLGARLDLARRYDLGGFAVWRLGGEDPQNGAVIRASKSR